MKKLFVLLAFLLPLCVQAKCGVCHYEARRNFTMILVNPDQKLDVKKGVRLDVNCCSIPESYLRFNIDGKEYEITHSEFSKHVINEDIAAVELR